MSKQKVNAATVAAPKMTVRSEVSKLAASIKAADSRMSKLILQAADLYLAGDLNDKEKGALLDAIPRQRKADFKAITEGPSNYREESEYPKGLQARARYMKLRADGYKPSDAADIATTKTTRKAVDEANGKAPAAPKAKGTDKRDDAAAAAADPWIQLHDVLKTIREKELKGNKEALRLLANAEALIKAAAQITA